MMYFSTYQQKEREETKKERNAVEEFFHIAPGLVLFATILMLPAILGWMGFGPWQ